ncbi:MAG: type II secretion system F family protein [Planctomycetaceae bacterium]
MSEDIIIMLAAFGGISCTVIALGNMWGKKTNRASERLQELGGSVRGGSTRLGGDDRGKVGNLMDKAAPKLSKALESTSELEQDALKVRLANAGFSQQNASQVFLTVKLGMLVIGTIFGITYGLASYGMTRGSLGALVIGGGLGFYLPELILSLMRSDRQGKIFLQMPDALDLLVVCVEAGLGLDAGMRRVAEELDDGAPEVCNELHTANMQLQMGKPRREVLRDLGVRTGVDDMRALAAILIQADKFGSSIAAALRVQSDSMRIKRKQIAEEKAAKTAVQMIFPLVLFIFPGIFVVLVGPAAIQMVNNFLTL